MTTPRVAYRHSPRSAAWDDPRSKAALEEWHWRDLYWDAPGASVDDEIAWTARAVEPLIDALRSPGIDVILWVFAKMLPTGLPAVAKALIDYDTRFHLAAAEETTGHGYIVSTLAIEYKKGFIDRIFEQARFGANENCLSLYFVPTEDFAEAAHGEFMSLSDAAKELTPRELRILELSQYLILLNKDCDVITLGAKGDRDEQLLATIKKLWPEAVEVESGPYFRSQ